MGINDGKPKAIRVYPDAHAELQQLTRELSVKLGRRVTTSEAVLLAVRYARGDLDDLINEET